MYEATLIFFEQDFHVFLTTECLESRNMLSYSSPQKSRFQELKRNSSITWYTFSTSAYEFNAKSLI